MASSILTALGMCLLLGQTPTDAVHTNQRSHRIPVKVEPARRADIRDLLLYASTDQGRTWQQLGAITPEQDAFNFHATKDGTYWLRVALVSRAGTQEPSDKALMSTPPDLKMVIDTTQPIVRSLRAQRDGDDIFVNWEVQEDHLDFGTNGMRLEYQAKDAVQGRWSAAAVVPGLKGQARFRVDTRQPLTIRLSVRDRAGNESFGLADAGGALAAVGFTQNAAEANPPKKDIPMPLVTGDVAPLKKPLDPIQLPIGPPPVDVFGPQGGNANPDKLIIPPPMKVPSGDRVVADTKTPPPPIDPPKLDPIAPPAGIGSPVDLQVGKPVAQAMPARRPLPPLQYVNNHVVMLEYELKRVGPSGIGGIELWLTRDDGDTWEQVADDEDAQSGGLQTRQQRKYEFRDNKTDRLMPDGVYGLTLVVKNRAGLGKKPRPGNVPEMRIEIDTKLPDAQLFQPIPDPQHPDHVLLRWSAEDRNLASNPIGLEYAQRREGPWTPIGADLENTGRYSWKVTNAVPVQVYLRLRVRDRAGNEAVAVTAQPQFVDLMEPEGALIGIQPSLKRP